MIPSSPHDEQRSDKRLRRGSPLVAWIVGTGVLVMGVVGAGVSASWSIPAVAVAALGVAAVLYVLFRYAVPGRER